MMTLIIAPAGLVRCLYAEAIDLRSLGELHIARASRIEPDGLGNWWADLSRPQVLSSVPSDFEARHWRPNWIG